MRDQNKKTTSPFLGKLDGLVYGLIYPAFLGDMLYDLIHSCFEKGPLKGIGIWIAFCIVLLNMLDYMHLYVDMKGVVNDCFNEVKGPVYIWCDIVTSVFFFSSFLLLRYHELVWAMALLGFIPFITAVYKEHYAVSKADRRFCRRYAIVFLILMVTGICIFCCECTIYSYFLFLAVAELLVYSIYVFRWFPSYKKNATLNNEGPCRDVGVKKDNG